MSKSFAVVYEGLADFTTATELADRVLVGTIDWMDETLLDSQRRWLREDQSGNRLAWSSIPRRAREVGIRVRGHFGGQPAMPDARGDLSNSSRIPLQVGMEVPHYFGWKILFAEESETTLTLWIPM